MKLSSSLSKDFYILAVVIVLCFVVLSGWHLKRTDQAFQAMQQEAFVLGSKRINGIFKDTFDFTEHLMSNIAVQIKHSDQSPEAISAILRSFSQRESDVLKWSTFLWMDKDFKVVATNNFGIIKQRKDLSKRDYIPKTVLEPNKIHIGKAVYGITSGQWAIPAGYGVLDKRGNYIGSVVTGINIKRLTNKLTATFLDSPLNFAIYSKKADLVLKSSSFEENDFLLHHIANDKHSFPLDISRDDYRYCIVGMEGYPYMITLQKETMPISQMLINEVEFIIVVSFILITVMFIVYILRQNILQPMNEIAETIDHLQVPGTTSDFTITKSSKKEIKTLIQEIGKLKVNSKALSERKEYFSDYHRGLQVLFQNLSNECDAAFRVSACITEMLEAKILGPVDARYIDYVKELHQFNEHLQTAIFEAQSLYDERYKDIEEGKEEVYVSLCVEDAIHKFQNESKYQHIDIIKRGSTKVESDSQLLYKDPFIQTLLEVWCSFAARQAVGQSYYLEVQREVSTVDDETALVISSTFGRKQKPKEEERGQKEEQEFIDTNVTYLKLLDCADNDVEDDDNLDWDAEIVAVRKHLHLARTFASFNRGEVGIANQGNEVVITVSYPLEVKGVSVNAQPSEA